MKSFGWSPEFVRKRITGAQGWAYYAWATAEANAGYMQSPLTPRDGYIAGEIERLKNGRRT